MLVSVPWKTLSCCISSSTWSGFHTEVFLQSPGVADKIEIVQSWSLSHTKDALLMQMILLVPTSGNTLPFPSLAR